MAIDDATITMVIEKSEKKIGIPPRADVAQAGKSERRYTVDLTDEAGEVCASCEKLLSIRARQASMRARAAGPLTRDEADEA